MQWLNEPASWQRTGDVLRVSVDPGTDFWRRTGYGYIHDNGHVYGALLPGDLDVSVRVRGAFASQYDQAGIMLRADEDIWLKTGLEFFEGRPRLSTVVTVGWSSWMVADLPPGTDEVTLRVSRRGDAVEVRYIAGEGAAELAALVFMPPDREMLAGVVCAAPEGSGFSVAFHDLRIAGREWNGQVGADVVGWAGESVSAAAGWPLEEAGWEDERADGAAAGWTGDKAHGAGPGRAEDKADGDGPGWAGDKADGATRGRAGKPAPGVSAGWGGELPASESLDWAKPQASDAAEDWDRLSLSVSSTWNAFAVDKPATKQPEEPAGEKPEKPGADQAGRVGGNGTSEVPEPPADLGGESGPSPAAGKPREPHTRGRNGRGRNKDKQPAPSPPVLPAPADPADEWISLLTAESAEELSGLGPVRE